MIVQVAGSIVLLIGAGLFLRSLGKAHAINIGFDPANALALDVDLKLKNLSDERGAQFYREMLRRVERLPGVRSATLANLAPLDTATPFRDVLIPEHDPLSGRPGTRISFNHVGPAYFETMAIPLRSGRGISERDDAARPGVVVINETMAQQYWRGENPIGRQITLVRGGEALKPLEIVGIANDVKYRSLGEEPTPHIYVPFFQDYSPDMTLLVRTAGDPGAALVAVQRELQNQDRDVQGFFARTLVQHIGLALVPARLAASLSAIFGGFALVLATLGIYAVVSYTARQRTREIGLRMALGAQPGDILHLVMAQTEKLALLGIAVGLAAAFELTRFLSGLLYGVSPADAWTYVTVALLLLGVALVASYFPARRAMRVDPMVALRYE
jgi:putative ABC transport system permease protein